MELKLEHTGLSVADLERSISFYRDIVGMEFVEIIESPPETKLGSFQW